MLAAVTRPAARRVVQSLPAYVPGARVGVEGAYKLSSNENPFPPLPSVVDVVARAAADMNRYPDMFATDLAEALAKRHNVTPDAVVAGCGSVAVLGHVLQAFCDAGDEVVHAWRSFEAYPIAISLTGAVGVPVTLDADGRHDLPAMAAAVGPRTKVVLVCTPNNPTGPAVHADELDAFLAAVPEHVVVVLDEAYVHFVRDAAVPDGERLLATHPNLVVLRTFSKAYGLAGLRVGYALAHPEARGGDPDGVDPVRREPPRAGRGAGVARRGGRADGARRRDRRRAWARARRPARPGLGGAGQPGELRVAAHR